MIKLEELQKFQNLIDFCGKCGDCASSGTQMTTAKRHVSKPCPVKNVLGFEAYDARGRILILKSLLENRIEMSDSLLKWAYTCTGCGSCKETCLAIEGGIDTPRLIEAFRQDLVKNRKKLFKHIEILDNIVKNQNPYGEPQSDRQGFLNGRKCSQNSEYILYLGCTSSYRQQNIARASIDLLDNLGVDFSIIKDEPCCGSIIKRYGYINSFKEIANSNLDKLKKTQIKKIIFPCAGCYRTYKIDYADYNTDSLQFFHLSEFLDKFLKENPSEFKLKNYKKIGYHDPCHLGRHAGVYEAPRNLLKQIKNSSFIELDALRNYSHCCGAGGGVKSSNPKLAIQIAENRNMEAVDKTIDILVSACPFCEKNLKDGINGNVNGLKILDISEILLETFEKELSSEIVTKDSSLSEITKKYMEFLSEYPEIFSDLVNDSVLDFAIYDSIDALDEETPMDIFHVIRTGSGIGIQAGKADNADLELALSTIAIVKLVQTENKSDYAKLFGAFYNDPDEEEGWIDFVLHKRTKTLIDMGYGRFAEAAGILEDEEDALNM
jgi:heterodisulfide reductase subunit D